MTYLSFSGIKCYKLNLMQTNGYNLYPPNTGYGLLIADEGTVYYSGMSTETLNWICRMLGYQSYYSSRRYSGSSYSWQQNFPVRYSSLECSGNVVPQCRYQEIYTSYYNGLYIYCNARTQYGDTTNFYLADRSGAYTQQEYGLLMYNGGTVSGRKFGDETADLMCYIMGYKGAMSWEIGRRYFATQESLRIKVTNLNCLIKDRAFPVCTNGTDAANSTHDDDVWLWCDKPNTNNLFCPPGNKKYSSNQCFECKANTYSPDPTSSTSCLSCPTRSTSLAGSTICSCDEGTYMNSAGDQCLTCPEKSTSQKGSTFCSCEAGTYLYSDYSNCVKCPQGTVSQEGSMDPTDCIPCPGQSLSLNNGKACSCDKGYGWEWITDKEGSCKACPANFYKDKDQGTCVKCPHEATSLPLSQDCQCPSGLSWDGSGCVDCASPNNNAGVCDCSPGTFRSEESGQCELCPPNHFSGKFATVCKMCPVFTVSVPQSAECTSCPKGYSWKNYTCTECPENHVGNGATCSVCPEGTSPSKDKTICQKSAVDGLSITSLVFSLLIIAAVGGNAFFTWRERRARIVLENLQLTYQAGSSTMTSGGKVKGRRCMCPSCPCSEVPKPALPERGKAVEQDDVYANFT